jgi:antitoxin component YwqK of YwqJK toxin-antitoxin module
VKNKLFISLASTAALLFTGCGNDSGPNRAKEQSGIAREIPNLREGDFWDGFQSDFKVGFRIDDEECLIRTADGVAFTGEITTRIAAGALSSRASYLAGKRDGNSFIWYESGALNSNTHFREGIKEGLEIIWTEDGQELSRKYYIDGIEDLSKSKDKEDGEDVVWGQSPATKALAKWTGKGNELGEKFAGNPSRDGTLFIRETEELYTGTITALDDSGKKEAELNFKEGRWDGAITKWDLEGNIWEKGEFTAGKLIGFEIKGGKPFDPNQIIESSPFGN